MSVKIMGAVWDCDLPQNEKLVLLAMADHADHDGGSIYPAMERLAWKTGYTKRSVQAIVRKLEERKILDLVGITEYQTKLYRINLKMLPERPLYKGGEIFSPPTDGGENFAPGGVKSTTSGGENISPKPSLNHQHQPSREEEATAEIFRTYNAKIGPIDSNAADVLESLRGDYPDDWIIEALEIGGKNKARHVNYITKILADWQLNGKDSKTNGNGKKKWDAAAIQAVLEGGS